MIDAIASCDDRIVKVDGPVRSGKTEALVRRCATLLEQGVEGRDILVETSSARAAQAFRTRLESASQHLGAACLDVRVQSMTSICVDVLSAAEAQSLTGRAPYLLNHAEYTFLLEDLKTTGQQARRLRSMLAHMRSSWALAIPESKWVAAGEEEVIYSFLISQLESRNAMLPEEVAFRCVTYLESDAGQEARHAFSYVLADDYQNLSAAEQKTLCLLAGTQLVVTGCSSAVVERGITDAYPDGFTEFDLVRRNVTVFQLPERKTAGLECQVVKWKTPEEEIDGATKYLRVIADRDELQESRICVLVPNRQWAKAARTVLKKRGFKVSDAALNNGLRGDPRDTAHCNAIVAYTKLALLADDHNIVAWRSACGIGNHLTNSDAWMRLVEWGGERDLTLYDALAEASAIVRNSSVEPFLRARALTEPFDEYRSFIKANRGRKGFSLLAACGAENLSEFTPLNDMVAGDEDAATMFALARSIFSDPVFAESQQSVRLATPENVAGLEFDVVFALGCVDGFFPRREAFEVVSTDEERARVLEADRCAFSAAVAKGTRMVVASYFAKADLELAERTKMQVTRVRSEHEKRIALVRPSCLLEEGPFPAAGVCSGEQVLANLQLG